MPRTPQHYAKRRGRQNEADTAALLNGYVYVGQAGDVVAGDTIIECKYRKGYAVSGALLRSWIAQAKSNATIWTRRGQPKKWAIELYGGRGTERLIILSLSDYKELRDADRSDRRTGALPDDAGGARAESEQATTVGESGSA